jgi:hypothetical protein
LSLHTTKASNVLYKELSPWEPEFRRFCERNNLRVLISPFAKPTSTEVYAVRTENLEVGGQVDEIVEKRASRMLALLSGKTGPDTTILRQQVMTVLEHEYVYEEPPADRKFKLADIDVTEIVEQIEEERGAVQPPHNKYRSVQELGTIRHVGDHRAGIYWNSVVERITRGLNNLTHFKEEWGLTDVSTAGTFRVYDEKVDTCPVENHSYRELEDEVWEVMKEKMLPRMAEKPRMLTYKEACERLRNAAAVGMKGIDDWMEDPKLEEKVTAEYARILKGRPRIAWVNTMGKRGSVLELSLSSVSLA